MIVRAFVAGVAAAAGLSAPGPATATGKVRTATTRQETVSDIHGPRLDRVERIVAVRGGGYFPVLIKLRDGRLGAVVRGGAPHIGIKGRLDWIDSGDGGRTWSKPKVIVDSKWDDRNPAVGQMADGTVVVAYAEARTYDASGKWDTSAGQYELFYVLSHDGGANWTRKRKLFTGPIRGGSPFGRVVVLSDGTALMSLYGGLDRTWKGQPRIPPDARDLTGIVRSRDNGRTWQDFSLVSARDHNEMSLLAITNKSLLAVVRTKAGSVDAFFSQDGGYNWRGPAPITQAGQHPADLCRLQSGRLLMVYGNRREPFGVGAVMSCDGGKSWDYAHRVLLAWDSLRTDCGYPSVVQLDEGTIVVMYYSVGAGALGSDEFALVLRCSERDIVARAGPTGPSPSRSPCGG